MRAAVAANSKYPEVLFVHLGTPEDGIDFFGSMWPHAQALADPSAQLYRDLGLTQAKSSHVMNLGLMACTVRAIAKGNLPGVPNADPLQMPGLFLVQGARILWQHDYSHAGDSPDWPRLPTLLEQEGLSLSRRQV